MPATPTEPAAGVLAPGVSFFQVLKPSPVRAANGDPQFQMIGPFLDLAQASQFANMHPGSLITVTLVLHQATALAPSSILKAAG